MYVISMKTIDFILGDFFFTQLIEYQLKCFAIYQSV